MATIALATFEIHPTTRGGCGVLLHHAAEHLLRRGHQVVFLLDVPRHQFKQFDERDRLDLPHPERCRAYDLRELCRDMPYRQEQVPCDPQWTALRFMHGYLRFLEHERPDFVEFFEYCGVAYYALLARLFGLEPPPAPGGVRPVLGVRLHNPLELIDHVSPTRCVNADRYTLYGLERAALELCESVLTPTSAYFSAHFAPRDPGAPGYAIDPAKVVVSQSPKVDFPRAPSRPDKGAGFSIVYFGRLWQFKGVDQFVHAAVLLMKRRPELDFTVELIGPDSAESPLHESYAEYLRSLVPGHLRPRFVFPGHLGHDETAQRLGRALLAVFPNRFESFCYALHEVYDAGVPVIARDIPGFADFFRDGDNCLLYDGSTEALLGAMERLVDDDALRARLTRPYAVAERPLGAYYDAPAALAPVAPRDPAPGSTRVLAVVLAERGHETARPTLDALAAQTEPACPPVVLVGAEPDAEETMWWLGRSWHARDALGGRLDPGDILTRDALVIFRAGDRPDPTWLARCARALGGRERVGFAGTWARTHAGALAPSRLDLAPEAYPFEHGPRLTRALLPTAPGRLLFDLFDAHLGALGEIGYLWSSVASRARGHVLPVDLLTLSPDEPSRTALDMNLAHFLLTRHGRPFADRLVLLAGLLHERAFEGVLGAAAPEAPAPAPAGGLPHDVSVGVKLKLAGELGGRDLMRLAVQKLASRVRYAGRPGPSRPRH